MDRYTLCMYKKKMFKTPLNQPHTKKFNLSEAESICGFKKTANAVVMFFSFLSSSITTILYDWCIIDHDVCFINLSPHFVLKKKILQLEDKNLLHLGRSVFHMISFVFPHVRACVHLLF